MARARTATRTGQHRGQIVEAVSIRARPPEAAERAVPGRMGTTTLRSCQKIAPADLLEKMLEERYTRVPIYNETIDEILGVIHLKDLVKYVRDGGANLQDIVRRCCGCRPASPFCGCSPTCSAPSAISPS